MGRKGGLWFCENEESVPEGGGNKGKDRKKPKKGGGSAREKYSSCKLFLHEIAVFSPGPRNRKGEGGKRGKKLKELRVLIRLYPKTLFGRN